MCIFCKIISGEKPCYEVYKSNEVTAFLDIHPIVPGHTVVIPNEHVKRLDRLQDDSVGAALMKALVEVSNRLMDAGICTDFTILSDNGLQAEQDIPHLHFHVIPRYAEEDFAVHAPTNKQAAKERELLDVWKMLQKNK